MPSHWPDTSPRDKSGNRLSRHLRRAKHCARRATRVVYEGHDPLRGCYHHNHLTDGKVEAHGQGQTWTAQRVAWSSAAKVLTSQDLQESRAGFLGSEARLAGGQLSVLPRWGEGGRRPTGAGSGEKQSWAGPQEQRGLQATMWAPAMGPFSHLKPLGHLLGCPATSHTQQPLSVQPWGGAPGPKARSAACQEIYPWFLTAEQSRRWGLSPRWSAMNWPPVSR